MLVNIYSCLHHNPLELKNESAALFLDTISRAEGCWAFNYPEDDIKKIRAFLIQSQQKSKESRVTSFTEEEGEEQTMTTQAIVEEDFSYTTETKVL